MAAGLALTIASYALIYAAVTPLAIVAAIIVYQAALNMMLSPLAAWAADTVPDDQKGLLGGLPGAGAPIGAMAGVLVTLPALPTPAMQLAAVCVMIATLALPLLVAGAARPVATDPVPFARAQRPLQRIDLFLLWLARLLVQVAGSVLFAFLLYYFQSLPGPPSSPADVARLSGLTLLAGFPLALLLGRASDRIRARRSFLFGTAMAMSGGLAVMALRPDFSIAVAGYALFGCGLAI